MSYTTNIAKEGLASEFLVVLKPRRIVTGFSLVSGSVYSASFDYGYVSELTVDGTSLTAASSSSLSAGEFYYNPTTQVLYFRKSDSTSPAANTVVVTYELYVSTTPLNATRIPTDATSNDAYFEGVILSAPNVKFSMSEIAYGYTPVFTSQLVLANIENQYYKHVYDSSFNLIMIDIYQLYGEFKATNIKKLFSVVGSDVSASDSKLTINLKDKLAIFDQSFAAEYYADVDPMTGLLVDPAFVGKPINIVYGRVDGVRGVNYLYSQLLSGIGANATFSFVNTTWVRDITGIPAITGTKFGSSTNTTTKTYVTSYNGITEGDRIKIAHGATVEYVEVISKGLDAGFGNTPYIIHSIVGAPFLDDTVPHANLTTVTLYEFPRVTALIDGIKYELFPGRDYEYSELPGNAPIAGISFLISDPDFSTNTGITLPISDNITVYGRVYGKSVELPATFGDLDTVTYTACNPVIVIYNIMAARVGITDGEIDLDNFSDMYTALSPNYQIGLCVPSTTGGDVLTFREVLGEILTSCLLRLYLNNDGKWALSQLGPISSTEETLDDNDIVDKSFGFDFKYEDILSDVIVQYDTRDIQENYNVPNGTGKTVSATSDTARYLHKVSQQKTFKSAFIFVADASTLASRLAFVFGDRQGQFKFSSSLLRMPRTIGESVTVDRTRMPGYDFDASTQRSKDFSIIEINKGLNGVDLVLDDQKGIQDNQGDW